MLLYLLLACAPGSGDAALPLHDLPACEPLSPSADLDLDTRCAAGVCANTPYEEFVALLGEGDCASSFSGSIRCEWPAGVYGYFDDDDDDGLPDPAGAPGLLYVGERFAGADENGLGLGVSFQCWMDIFGPPDELALVYVLDAYVIEALDYGDLGFVVRADDTPDGVAESIVLDD